MSEGRRHGGRQGEKARLTSRPHTAQQPFRLVPTPLYLSSNPLSVALLLLSSPCRSLCQLLRFCHCRLLTGCFASALCVAFVPVTRPQPWTGVTQPVPTAILTATPTCILSPISFLLHLLTARRRRSCRSTSSSLPHPHTFRRPLRLSATADMSVMNMRTSKAYDIRQGPMTPRI
jgi:hypothetical protein